jgi:hypothetical protein
VSRLSHWFTRQERNQRVSRPFWTISRLPRLALHAESAEPVHCTAAFPTVYQGSAFHVYSQRTSGTVEQHQTVEVGRVAIKCAQHLRLIRTTHDRELFIYMNRRQVRLTNEKRIIHMPLMGKVTALQLHAHFFVSQCFPKRYIKSLSPSKSISTRGSRAVCIPNPARYLSINLSPCIARRIKQSVTKRLHPKPLSQTPISAH